MLTCNSAVDSFASKPLGLEKQHTYLTCQLLCFYLFRFKSADELEEEMLAKIPKFKARPLNKKVSIIT